METESSYAAPSGPPWRIEPFRIFFVLGVILSWIGVGHWLFYAFGWSTTYSCELHGLLQMQGFMMAFAIGFLLTALPRRTQSAPPSHIEMSVIGVALTATAIAALAENWAAIQVAYGIVFVVLVRFALVRFLTSKSGRRPPAAFVLIPLGILHGCLGAAVILGESRGVAPQWVVGFGNLLVEQGVFLCFVVGIGSLVLPLMGGTPPPPDLGSSPRETWKAALYAAAGLTIFASLLLEQLGWETTGPLLRALVVALGVGLGGRAWVPPAKPGLHRRLVWLSVWMIPLGLTASAVWPDFRVPALHVTFIGGFGLMAFGVATHVALSHLGMEDLALGRPRAVVALGTTFLLALLARIAADASETYFTHLGWAAVFWLIGSGTWLAFFLPRFLRATDPPEAAD